MAKISVIIPVYNVEKYLRRCLDSIINQTYKDLEIILINDGSTDGSPEICAEYQQKDNRIKIVSQSNSGPSSRNSGLAIATGEYIGFVDSDDWISNDFYENLHNAITKYNADIAVCSVIRKNEKQEKIRFQYQQIESAEDIQDKLKLAKFNTHRGIWNKLYKKSLIDKVDNFKDMYYEDGIFTLQTLYYADKIVSVPNSCYYYYINPKSIVKTRHSLKKIQDKNIMKVQILNFATEQGFLISDKKNMPISFKLEVLGVTIFVIKETQKEKRYYLFGSILLFKCFK